MPDLSPSEQGRADRRKEEVARALAEYKSRRGPSTMDADTHKALSLVLQALYSQKDMSANFLGARSQLSVLLDKPLGDAKPNDGSEKIVPDAIAQYEGSFVRHFKIIQACVHQTAVDHGWWPKPEQGERDRSVLETHMLIVSEIAEASESWRLNVAKSDHIPEFSGEEEELADAIIRIMDIAERRQLRVAEALVAKAAYNDSREFRHGGKRA